MDALIEYPDPLPCYALPEMKAVALISRTYSTFPVRILRNV